jgi:hypothetical protein
MPGLVPGMFVFEAQLRRCPVSRAHFGNTRHCEEQSDEAIQNGPPSGLLRFARNDEKRRSKALVNLGTRLAC